MASPFLGSSHKKQSNGILQTAGAVCYLQSKVEMNLELRERAAGSGHKHGGVGRGWWIVSQIECWFFWQDRKTGAPGEKIVVGWVGGGGSRKQANSIYIKSQGQVRTQGTLAEGENSNLYATNFLDVTVIVCFGK